VEYKVLRAEGYNMIGDHEKALRDAHDARSVVSAELARAAALQLGIAHMQLGRPDSARHWFTQANEGNTAMEAELRLGMLDRNSGRCADAVQRFDRVMAERADDLTALRERGACRSELGDTTGARRDLDRLVELAPRDAVSWNSRGYFHAQNGRYREAIADYDRAIKLDPNYSFAFNNRGWAYHKLGDNERAMKNVTLAARKRRNNPYVYRNLGLIALAQGDTIQACGHFRMALDLRFTALHGSEVEELVRANCSAVAPRPTQSSPSDRPAVKEGRSNAPVRSNAP
jgi:tetratricopeptide (TPR) repeat protein